MRELGIVFLKQQRQRKRDFTIKASGCDVPGPGGSLSVIYGMSVRWFVSPNMMQQEAIDTTCEVLLLKLVQPESNQVFRANGWLQEIWGREIS